MIITVLAVVAFTMDHIHPGADSIAQEPVQWAINDEGKDERKDVVLIQDAPAPVKMQVAVVLSKLKLQYGNDNGAVNAAIAARVLDGATVRPGGIFSFNSTVGPRLESRGYVEGASIMQTEEGLGLVPDVGGGVCRTSTALHQAVQLAGLEVVERHNHGLPVGYAAPGRDAAVAWPDLDYKFRNVRNQSILLKASSGRDYCDIEIWEIY